jgi:hypothetical protein
MKKVEHVGGPRPETDSRATLILAEDTYICRSLTVRTVAAAATVRLLPYRRPLFWASGVP